MCPRSYQRLASGGSLTIAYHIRLLRCPFAALSLCTAVEENRRFYDIKWRSNAQYTEHKPAGTIRRTPLLADEA